MIGDRPKTGLVVGLFLLGGVLFNFPILTLFNLKILLFGIPLLYLYLFGAWTAFIVLIIFFTSSTHKVPPPESSSIRIARGLDSLKR